ncbi:uncharacterized protein [Nicotiana sylvestris]|uniref:uncharacterized protein n=1 Tax=Nicotiana sylvestris TaxID=4096 RepID=UPI00388C3C0C
MDLLKYIFQNPMPTGKLAKWQILLSEFNIVYVTQKAVKGQALADDLAENPVDGEYEPLEMYFPDEVELLVIGDLDLLIHQVREEWATKNSKILPYLHHIQELRKRFTKTEFRHVPKVQNEFADALATLLSMIHHPGKNFIDHIPVKIHDQPAYCAYVEEEADGKPLFHDIKEYLTKGEYPELANPNQKRTLWRTQMNGAVEVANRNIKKILRKVIEKHKQWHEKLSFALLGYRTIVRISTRATPYILVYGTEAVIPAEKWTEKFDQSQSIQTQSSNTICNLYAFFYDVI